MITQPYHVIPQIFQTFSKAHMYAGSEFYISANAPKKSVLTGFPTQTHLKAGGAKLRLVRRVGTLHYVSQKVNQATNRTSTIEQTTLTPPSTIPTLKILTVRVVQTRYISPPEVQCLANPFYRAADINIHCCFETATQKILLDLIYNLFQEEQGAQKLSRRLQHQQDFEQSYQPHSRLPQSCRGHVSSTDHLPSLHPHVYLYSAHAQAV